MPDISKMKANGDVKGLIALLHWHDSDGYSATMRVRNRAIQALVELGDPSTVSLLIEYIGLDVPEGRYMDPLKALGAIGDPSAVGPIADLQDRFIESHYAYSLLHEDIIKALGNLGPTAVPPLIKALQHRKCGNGPVCNAARALGDIGDPSAVDALAKMLMTGVSAITEAVVEALGKLGPTAIAPLMREMSRNPQFKNWNAARALSSLAPDSFDPLVAALKHRSPGVRARAAVALGLTGMRSARKPLRAAMKDKNEDVRNEAKKALDWLGNKN